MSGNLLIRVLTAADAGAAATLHAAMPEPWSAADWTVFLSDPLVVGLGAGDGGALAGVVLLRVVAGEAEVLTIVVAAPARGKGIGARLLAAGLDEAGRRGAETAFLEVAVDNAEANALYAAAGFVEIGRRRGYYRRAEGAVDARLMRRAP